MYLEDYLMFLAGKINAKGEKIGYWNYSEKKPIKLATYDISPVNSMSESAFRAERNQLPTCLTDRQLVLARRIVEKYRRQLASVGVVLPESVESIPLKFGTRYLDRTRTLNLNPETNKLELKFPYIAKIISELHVWATESSTEVTWDNQLKCWHLDFTEENLKKILDLFKDDESGSSELVIGKNLEPIIEEFLKIDSSYLPTLDFVDGKLCLRNCHETAIDYLQNLGWDDRAADLLPYWAALMPALEIKVGQSVADLLKQDYGSKVAEWIISPTVLAPSANQPTGQWFDDLKTLNSALPDFIWVFSLEWWSKKTSWADFTNAVFLNRSSTIPSIVLDSKFIFISDTVINSGSGNSNYLRTHSIKSIYISDIGGPL